MELNENYIDIVEELELEEFEKLGHIYFINDVTDESAKELILKMKKLERLDKKEIKVFIHSYGGSLDSLFAIVDEFDRLKKKGIIIKTHVMGIAFSAGSALSVLGTKGYRSCGKSSNFMFHPASYALDADYSGNQAEITKFFDKCNANMSSTIANAIGFSNEKEKKKFLARMDKGVWLFADEALKMGVVDVIEE